MLTGGCYCRAIRYEVTGEPFHSTLCHCSDCRRVAGAPAVAWFSVAASGFRVTAGAPRRFRSSPRVEREFCGACGTALTFRHAGLAGEIDVTTCSLDAPELVPPKDHTWVGERLTWLQTEDGLPGFAGARA
jgi:hypothetical protein